MPTVLQTLKEHPFLAEFDDRQVQRLAECGKLVEFKADETIFREGEDARAFYLVRKGRVRLVMHVPPEESVNLDSLKEGDVIGWSWLIPPYRCHFDAVATDDVEATALDAEKLRKLCDENHDLGYELLKRSLHVVESRLMSTRMRLIDMYNWS